MAAMKTKAIIRLDPKVFAAFAQMEVATDERLVKPQELERAMSREPNIADHYWVIEYLVPANQSKTGKKFVNTLLIGGWAPVVKIGQDQCKSRHEIEMLKIIFEHHNPGIQFGLSYTSRESLDKNIGQWFEWGDLTWDLICTECGQITPSPIIVERYICKGCDPFGRNYYVRLPEQTLCEEHAQ